MRATRQFWILRRKRHVGTCKKRDANDTSSSVLAIMARYAMVRPLLGVGCPAAVDFVNRVIATVGAKSPAEMVTARRMSIGDLAR
jgi:hypothetical protein